MQLNKLYHPPVLHSDSENIELRYVLSCHSCRSFESYTCLFIVATGVWPTPVSVSQSASDCPLCQTEKSNVKVILGIQKSYLYILQMLFVNRYNMLQSKLNRSGPTIYQIFSCMSSTYSAPNWQLSYCSLESGHQAGKSSNMWTNRQICICLPYYASKLRFLCQELYDMKYRNIFLPLSLVG